MHVLSRHRKCRLLSRFLADRSANFAVMTALSTPFAIALCALAVDQGALFTERRSAQALTDIAAITAAANIGKAGEAALLTFRDNGISNAEIDLVGSGEPDADRTFVSVTPGRYDKAAALGFRFQPGGAPPFNAVRVTMRKTGSLYFGGALIAPPTIVTTAIASASAEAAFSVGSGLVEEDTQNSPVLNAILGGLLGTSLSLRAADYRALAATDVDALTFIDALATRLDLTGVSYDEVLASKASVGEIARAVAGVPGLDGTVKALVEAMAGKATASVRIPVSQLIDLGPAGHLAVGQGSGKPSVDANILEMLTAAAALANGKNQADIDLGTAVPGLASVNLRLAIGEPAQHSAWLALGETGTLVRTAQIRARLMVKIGGLDGLAGSVVTLPVYIDLARAEGRLADIACPTGRIESLKVKIDTTPGVADLRIADIGVAAMNDFSRIPALAPAKLVNVSLLGLGLVSVSGQAQAAIENTQATGLVFNHDDIENHTVRSTPTENLTGSLAGSLFASLQLEAYALGLKIDVPGGISSALGKTLAAASAPVDTLLNELLRLLGVKVGYADVRVTGANCGRSVLVQ